MKRKIKKKTKIKSKPKKTCLYRFSVVWVVTTTHTVMDTEKATPEQIIERYKRYKGKYFHVHDWNHAEVRPYHLTNYDHQNPHITNVWREDERIWKGPPINIANEKDIDSD